MNEILCGDFRAPHVFISTGGGENVAPVPIEEDIKAELGEVVSQAMLVGISIQFFFTYMYISCQSVVIQLMLLRLVTSGNTWQFCSL